MTNIRVYKGDVLIDADKDGDNLIMVSDSMYGEIKAAHKIAEMANQSPIVSAICNYVGDAKTGLIRIINDGKEFQVSRAWNMAALKDYLDIHYEEFYKMEPGDLVADGDNITINTKASGICPVLKRAMIIGNRVFIDDGEGEDCCIVQLDAARDAIDAYEVVTMADKSAVAREIVKYVSINGGDGMVNIGKNMDSIALQISRSAAISDLKKFLIDNRSALESVKLSCSTTFGNNVMIFVKPTGEEK